MPPRGQEGQANNSENPGAAEGQTGQVFQMTTVDTPRETQVSPRGQNNQMDSPETTGGIQTLPGGQIGQEQVKTQPYNPEGQARQTDQEVSPGQESEQQTQVKSRRSKKCVEYDKREVKEGQGAKPKRSSRSRKKKVSGQEMLDYMRKQEALNQIPGAEAIFTPKVQTSLAHFFSPNIFNANTSGQKSAKAINSDILDEKMGGFLTEHGLKGLERAEKIVGAELLGDKGKKSEDNLTMQRVKLGKCEYKDQNTGNRHQYPDQVIVVNVTKSQTEEEGDPGQSKIGQICP